MRSLILLSLLAFSLIPAKLRGQALSEWQGRVVSGRSDEPVPFANIYNLTTRKGTISNVDGYFRIGVSGPADSIRISYIGFREQRIRPTAGLNPATIRLQEHVELLEEVTIRADDYSRLYEWVSECRRLAHNYKRADPSKAFYELKTFHEDQQVELVEGYFNIESVGYEIAGMKPKVGRLALQPFDNHYFISTESSRALILLHLMSRNARFPIGPTELTKARLRKHFYLRPDQSYVNEASDSVDILDYIPRDTSGYYFQGKIWLNRSKMFIEKITLNCTGAKVHPFLPLFRSDSLTGVSLSITKTFRYLNGQPVFHHIDFIYTADYRRRVDEFSVPSSTVKTRAVLYAYDHGSSFLLPRFNFHSDAIGDYRQIQAMPYNEFFWNCNDEYRLTDSLNSNAAYFDHPNSVTNRTLFNPGAHFSAGLLEHPFTRWNGSRIRFKDLSANMRPEPGPGAAQTGRYNLSVKIFADYNTCGDSTNILTATLFDPFESYYFLPLTTQAQCFINLYFDLCEIERRNLEKLLRQSDGQRSTFLRICAESQESLDKRLIEYQKVVQEGTNLAGMEHYNSMVVRALGIDNLDIFKPFVKN